MASTKFFFLGFEVDDELQTRLESCSGSDKSYLEDPRFLERVVIDEKSYIGRRLDADGIPLSTVEDSAKNVRSLISRVVPGWSEPVTKAVLSAVEQEISQDDVVIGG